MTTTRPFALAAFALLLTLAASLLGSSGCGGETPPSVADTTTVADTNGQVPIVDTKPPTTPLKENIDSILLSKSPFRALGCCADKQKRHSDFSCCYEAALARYKELRSAMKGPERAKLSLNDPILGECRDDPKCKKLLDSLEKIGKPPADPNR